MQQPAYSFLSPNSTRMLFLEKIVKCAACGGGADGGASGVVSFTFDGGSSNKIRAFVANVLLGNTLQDRLRALELGAGIEVPAVFATAKVGAAFGTLAAYGDLHGIRDHGTAHGTTQQFLEPRHLHPPGNIARRTSRPPLLRSRLNLLSAFTIRTVAVLIPALPVFPF